MEDGDKSGPSPIPTNASRNATSPTEVTSNQHSTDNVDVDMVSNPTRARDDDGGDDDGQPTIKPPSEL